MAVLIKVRDFTRALFRKTLASIGVPGAVKAHVMKLLQILLLPCFALVTTLGSMAPAVAQNQPTAASAAGCPSLLQHTLPRLQDEKPQSLCQYAGKVVLAVNTASFCSYTPQYRGLEDLYSRYKDRGLVVLGFPSNDFEQEKASNKEIAEFCENTFGVKFPMFGASSVRGAKANPVFQKLAAQKGAPDWNFNKYLIARDGRLVAHYPSRVEPTDRAFVAEIEKLLAAPVH